MINTRLKSRRDQFLPMSIICCACRAMRLKIRLILAEALSDSFGTGDDITGSLAPAAATGVLSTVT
jgi:hypothetical protein